MGLEEESVLGEFWIKFENWRIGEMEKYRNVFLDGSLFAEHLFCFFVFLFCSRFFMCVFFRKWTGPKVEEICD